MHMIHFSLSMNVFCEQFHKQLIPIGFGLDVHIGISLFIRTIKSTNKSFPAKLRHFNDSQSEFTTTDVRRYLIIYVKFVCDCITSCKESHQTKSNQSRVWEFIFFSNFHNTIVNSIFATKHACDEIKLGIPKIPIPCNEFCWSNVFIKILQHSWNMSVIPADFSHDRAKNAMLLNTQGRESNGELVEKNNIEKFNHFFFVSFDWKSKTSDRQKKRLQKMRADETSVRNKLNSFDSYHSLQAVFSVYCPCHAMPCEFQQKITMPNYLNKVKFNNKISGRARLRRSKWQNRNEKPKWN